MDELTAFERQMAGGLSHMGGAGRRVDPMAMTRAAATRSARWRFGSLFSAARFVVAGAIVALFGGFLLAGLLTQPSDDMAPAAVSASPSPTTTDDLLSGMVTEEVEPGVFHVLDDGAGHELVADPPVGLTVAPDGSVWLLRAALEPPVRGFDGVDAAYELGREGTFPFSRETDQMFADLAVGADRVAWLNAGTVQGGGVLATLDGSAWSFPTWPDGAEGVGAIEAAPDGAMWVIEEPFDPTSRVARIVEGEWTVLPPLDDPSLAGFFDGDGPGYGGFRPGYFAVSADGDVWLAAGGHQGPRSHDRIASPDGLLHFDGTGWEVVDLPPGGSGVITNDGPARTIEGWLAGPLALGTDGTLWVYLEQPGTRETTKINDPQAGHLARLDADGWSLFSATDDGVPKLNAYMGYEAPMAVDGNGTVWVAPEFHGVLAFDGSEWRQYLDRLHVNSLDVAPDGSVFATAYAGCDPTAEPGTPQCYENPDLERAGIYVITPEATAGSEQGAA